MPGFKRLALVSLVTLLIGTGTATVMAQTQPRDDKSATPPELEQQDQVPETATRGSDTDSEISRSKLALYAKATEKIQRIKQDSQRTVANTGNRDEANARQTEEQRKIVSAIESFGMTVDEYNQIAQQLQDNPGALKQLREIMGE